MSFVWKNKFIYWNFIALILVKAVLSYTGFQLASLLRGIPVFSSQEVVIRTNQLRSNLGISQLKESPTLSSAASQKLQDMINGQYFAHYSPSGISPWYWIEKNKYDYSYAGENLAIGFLSAGSTVDAWSGSATHRENLLNPRYKEIGVAVAPAKIQGNEGFLVVQLFATPKPKPATLTPRPTTKPAQLVATKTPLPTVSPAPTIPATKPQPNFKAAENPTTLTIANPPPQLVKINQALNYAFAFYTLIIFLASITLLVFAQASRGLVVKTGLSLALVVLALAIPVIHTTHAALIF